MYKFVYKSKFLHSMAKTIRLKSKPGKLIINRLAAILKEEGISNKALAAELGYEETTVSKWATNTIQPSPSTFLRIALTINRDLKDFFISTKDIDEGEKKKNLKILAEIAEKSKRTGKSKG
jgi:transcriptional regulator with XRE-family HTH domain